MSPRFIALSGLLAALCWCGSWLVSAQSGRGNRTPPPKPTVKPNTPITNVLNAPPGGRIVRVENDGVTSLYALQNGMTLLIRERHAAPLAAVGVRVKAGALHETDDAIGLSRLVERMIVAGGAPAKEAARLGGVFTSAASYDHTSFNLIAPAESLTPALELLSNALLKASFDANRLKQTATEAVLINRREQDAPAEFALERLYATAFAAHPLKRGLVASDAALNALTVEQAQAFFQTHYQPGNLILTIVGDVFTLQAAGQVQLTFGNLAKPTPTPTPTPAPPPAANKTKPASAPTPTPTPSAVRRPPVAIVEEPPQDKLRYANARADIGQPIVTVGYRGPANATAKEALKENATLEVLAAVLGLGRGARLAQSLREGQALREKINVVTEVSASYAVLPAASILSVQLFADPARIDRAEAEYFREIERFRRELLGEGELQRAKMMLEKRALDAAANIEAEVAGLAHHHALLGDFRLFDARLARLRAVTAQEVQQAAAKYLSLANTTVYEYEPRTAQERTYTPEKFADYVVTLAPGVARAVNADEVKPAVALKSFQPGNVRVSTVEAENLVVAEAPLPIKDFSVLRGPRAYVREDKSQPLLTIGVFFQGGRLIEDQSTSGTTELMLRTMLKSTTSRKADLLALELESYGGEVRIINEPDFFGFTLDVISRNAEPALKVLLDILENPYFDKPELARERDVLLADQERARDDAAARPVELLWLSLYPNHPYGLPRRGLPTVVKAATEEKLEAWYAKTIKRQFPLVVLVGDTDGSALVSRIFSEGFKRGELDKTLKADLPPLTQPPQDQIERRGRQQAAQAIGFRAPAAESNDNFALTLLAQLAGRSRLIDELRGKQSLIVDAPAAVESHLAAGAFYVSLATLPDHEQRAREALQNELGRLLGGAVTDEEFERARNSAIGEYAIALQAHPVRTLAYAKAVVCNRKPSDVDAQPDFIRAVKKGDLKRVAEAVIKLNYAGRGIISASPQNATKD